MSNNGIKNPNYKHGMCGTRFHRIWSNAKNRCNNQNNKDYAYYGGNGIVFSKKWDNFRNFMNDMYDSYLEHVKGHGEKDTTIDRINSCGDYCIDNCRWATISEQCRNRSTNHMLSFNGDTKTMVEWAEHIGMSYKKLHCRINKHKWDIERALTTP